MINPLDPVAYAEEVDDAGWAIFAGRSECRIQRSWILNRPEVTAAGHDEQKIDRA